MSDEVSNPQYENLYDGEYDLRMGGASGPISNLLKPGNRIGTTYLLMETGRLSFADAGATVEAVPGPRPMPSTTTVAPASKLLVPRR